MPVAVARLLAGAAAGGHGPWADLPVAQAALRLREHDGVDLSASTIRRITERRTAELVAEEDAVPARPTSPGVAAVIAEIDGGMVPPIQGDPDSVNRWVGTRLFWKEAKQRLAHAHGGTERADGATVNGGVEIQVWPLEQPTLSR